MIIKTGKDILAERKRRNLTMGVMARLCGTGTEILRAIERHDLPLSSKLAESASNALLQYDSTQREAHSTPQQYATTAGVH